MLSLQSFVRKGVSLGCVGLNQNLKDLKGDAIETEFVIMFYRKIEDLLDDGSVADHNRGAESRYNPVGTDLQRCHQRL